jgi:hypothetical protein
LEVSGTRATRGIDTIGRINLSNDTNSYVYSYVRTLSDLYLVEGLK